MQTPLAVSQSIEVSKIELYVRVFSGVLTGILVELDSVSEYCSAIWFDSGIDWMQTATLKELKADSGTS